MDSIEPTAAPQDLPVADEADRKPKEKKEKKFAKDQSSKHKKHHKKERHRSRTRSRTPPEADTSDQEAGAAAHEQPAVAVVPDEEGRGGEAPLPPPPLPGAAKPAATAATAAAAGAEDAEEGELPVDQLPAELGEAGHRLDERAEQGRRSRSCSPDRQRRSGSVAGRRDRSRDRSRSRSQRRDASETAAVQQHRERAHYRDAGGRELERDDSHLRSRSPNRLKAGEGRPHSHSPPWRIWDRALSMLPPRDRDRRRDPERRDVRRPDFGRDRFGEPAGRFDDRRRLDNRRHPRSWSPNRSRDTRKRSRSDDRRQRHRGKRENEEDEEFQRRVAAVLEQAGEDDEDRLIEERRRRRQEILAKHRSQQGLDQMASEPTATKQVQQQAHQQAAAAVGGAAAAPPLAAAPATGATPPFSRPPSGAGDDEAEGEGEGMDLSENEDEDAVVAQLGTTQAGALDIFRHDGGNGEPCPELASPSEVAKSGTGEAVDTELGRRLAARAVAEPDMFAPDDADDIFAATPTDVKEKETAAAAQAGQAAVAAAGARKGLLDNYDDAEGYYNFQVGEVIGEAGQGQYEVYATHGKGVFSSVLRARDLARRNHETGVVPEVAIKVIRANETMFKAGQMERVILRKLSEADVEGRRHCIRMLGSFEYRNHLCLVFEAMDMNLRELTKRYGRGIGLSINAVRVYAQQMLVSLYHLKNCGVLHADIKPDNILVNDRRTVVKLCDFGSAMFSGDNEITPYLVSRFYRAPEVILGLSYEYPMDMWSIGCVVYELFTGHILFPGKTNNEMLKLMMDVKGPFPKKMVKRAEFAFKHFEADPNMSFALLEEDPVTKRPVRRLISNPTVKKDFTALLAGQSPDRRKLAQLVDLLERMMQLDPDRRVSPKDALRHPFIREAPTTK